MNTNQESNWLEEIRGIYLDTADRKIADLRAAIEALESSPGDLECRASLSTLLHNLIGSGASYGFPSVSVVARRLSSALKRAKDEQMIARAGLIPILYNGLTELRRAFDSERERMIGG